MDSQLHLAAGSAADGPYRLAITPERAGWAYSGLRVLDLAPGAPHELRTGADEMLVPSMAVPGYDMYYLNVMAGPGAERAWLICDDPAHAWVRGSWAGQPADPRLPVGGPASRGQA
jgi:5-deoxy-glucuronate isomerase